MNSLGRLQLSKQNREQGFTLVELLIVILIIGILTAIAIPLFSNHRKAANDATVEADIRTAALATENWMVKNPMKATPPQVEFTGPTVGNYGGQEFNVSDGVTINIVDYGRNGQNIGEYVIYAFHENGSEHRGCSPLRYSSKEGGYNDNYVTNTC